MEVCNGYRPMQIIRDLKEKGLDIPGELTTTWVGNGTVRWWNVTEDIGEDEEGPLYITTEVITYRAPIRGSTFIVTIPKEFENDLASRPKLFGSFFNKNGSYGIPAIIHDYLTAGEFLPYYLCDLVFLHAMKWIPPVTSYSIRQMFFHAARVGGYKAKYQYHTEESVRAVRNLPGGGVKVYTTPEQYNALAAQG